ncbi:MAG: hypothetical protein GQ574_11095 [Crocinitomix sp.]|nr:hypothetical protein [Crocinitomix sp.]
MKRLLISLLLLTTQFSFGQDTLYLKSGEQLTVQIIELDTAINFVGYVYQGDTIYATTQSFEKIIYEGKLSSEGSLISTAIINDSEKSREAVLSKIKPNPKYLYGKWAVSTNLLGMIESNSRFAYVENGVFSLEPEYFINDHFSVKMPLHVGLPTDFGPELSYYGPYEMNDANADYLPTVKELDTWSISQLGHKRDLLFQVGLNPKYFFKGQRTFGWYLSQGFYVAQINLNRVDYYYTYQYYINNFGDYYWRRPSVEHQSFEEKRWVLHYEGAIGLSMNVLKNIGLTGEFGYTSLIKTKNEGVDQVFIRKEDDEYILDPVLVQHSPNYRLSQSFKPYVRVHLVFRFGAVKNVII